MWRPTVSNCGYRNRYRPFTIDCVQNRGSLNKTYVAYAQESRSLYVVRTPFGSDDTSLSCISSFNTDKGCLQLIAKARAVVSLMPKTAAHVDGHDLLVFADEYRGWTSVDIATGGIRCRCLPLIKLRIGCPRGCRPRFMSP